MNKFLELSVMGSFCSRRRRICRKARIRGKAVDRRPLRRHQGHPLRGSRIREFAAQREGADILSVGGRQVRTRHPFDQNFKYNLVIRHTLERIYNDTDDRDSADFKALEKYLKRCGSPTAYTTTTPTTSSAPSSPRSGCASRSTATSTRTISTFRSISSARYSTTPTCTPRV